MTAPVVPVQALVPVLARPREAEPLVSAQLPVVLVLLHPQEPELVVRLQPLVPAELPLAVPVEPLLSRQSFSAAMARSSS